MFEEYWSTVPVMREYPEGCSVSRHNPVGHTHDQIGILTLDRRIPDALVRENVTLKWGTVSRTLSTLDPMSLYLCRGVYRVLVSCIHCALPSRRSVVHWG